MGVNSSAFPCNSSDHRTVAARDGAARKNELIQPSRTEASVITRAPKMRLRRQAISLLASDMAGSLAFRNPHPFPLPQAGEGIGALLQITQIDQAVDFRLGQRLLQEIKPDVIVDGLLQAADRLCRHRRLVVKLPGLEHG